MNEKQTLGSETAKAGFRNEYDVVAIFKTWQTDGIAKEWLQTMGYQLCDIESVDAEVLSGYKTDVQVQVTVKLRRVVDVQNLQVKLVSNPKGFNQIDKRWVDKYVEMWNIPNDIVSILKRYTGEQRPSIIHSRDRRRMFADEFHDEENELILNWLKDNKILIIADLLKGRGKFAAEWTLVVQKGSVVRYKLCSMNNCMSYFGGGDVVVSSRGNYKIGRITMQRKGGDGGRDTAKMLQFKINPAELFENE